MSETTLPFDPEVTGLLREALAGRENGLFPTVTRRSLGALLALKEPLSPHALDLNRAQREMVSVAREEAAFLLNEAWSRGFLTDRTWGPVCPRFDTAGRELPPIEPARWRQRARFGLEHGGQAPEDRPWRNLLEEGLSADPLAWRRPLELLLAAHRLVPSESTRIRVGLELLRQDQRRSAERVFAEVAHDTHCDRIESIATGNVALCRFLASDLGKAVEWYRRSALTTEPRPLPVIYWHMACCQLGDESAALESARYLDELLSPGHPAVETAVDTHVTRKAAGHWRASAASGPLVRRISSRVGPATREIDHVFL